MVADSFEPFARKLAQDGAPDILVRNFKRQYRRLRQGQTGRIPLATIEPVPTLPLLDDLNSFEPTGRKELGRAVVLKLNGGLGTGMGLEKAKSLIPVRDGLTFLDLVARQVLVLRSSCGTALPLVLMNSRTTEQDSLDLLARYPELEAGQRGMPCSFLQHRVPKVFADSLLPVTWPASPDKEWCPPGHGDIYTALVTTGMLDKLLKAGFTHAFVSNCDNLGATLDPRILGRVIENNIPFLMEVTERTEADRKGGHLARDKRGHLLLRELAQCPRNEEEDFQDIRKHRYFNTNNLWLDLRAVAEHLEAADGVMELPLIVNRKTVDPRDPASPGVIQIESAMGAAIGVFDNAAAICVPRTRFSPVKATDDLLAVRSDAYVVNDRFHVVLDPRRTSGPPVVKLDAAYYKVIDSFDARFPNGAPSLIDCAALTIDGDIQFGKNVSVRGRVALKHAGPGQRVIPDGTVLE